MVGRSGDRSRYDLLSLNGRPRAGEINSVCPGGQGSGEEEIVGGRGRRSCRHDTHDTLPN